MINTSIHLTEEQHQQLLDVLSRRFKKMPDHVLLELERLTRHPMDLSGFQPKSYDVPAVRLRAVEPHSQNPDNVIGTVFSKPLTRREFMAVSASGLLSFLLLGTGVGWRKSYQTAENFSATITDANSDVTSLRETIGSIQETIRSCREVILQLQNGYPQTIYSIAQLTENIQRTQQLYSQFDETGMTVTEIIEFVVNIVSLVPDTQSYTQPVTALLEAVNNIPEIIFWAERALVNLDFWFSEEQGQGVNNKLLSPIQLIFDTIENNVKIELDSIQGKLTD